MQEHRRIDFRDQISKNKAKSFLLIVVVFGILILLGYCISFAFDPGYTFFIMILSIIISLLYVVISFYNSHKIAIASSGARKADKRIHRDYYNLVEGLTISAGLPMPELYIMPMKQINAFASGRDPKHAVVCVSEGALEKLERRELEGVLAHELGHIGNYDMRFMTLVAVLVGMISIVSEIFLRSLWMKNTDSDNKSGWIFIIIGIVLAILAPIVVSLVQLSISRKQEYSADATAVKFTRYPQGLIGALKKIKSDYNVDMQDKKVNKALAPLYFASPLKELTSTHPDINKRIAVLERM